MIANMCTAAREQPRTPPAPHHRCWGGIVVGPGGCQPPNLHCFDQLRPGLSPNPPAARTAYYICSAAISASPTRSNQYCCRSCSYSLHTINPDLPVCGNSHMIHNWQTIDMSTSQRSTATNIQHSNNRRLQGVALFRRRVAAYWWWCAHGLAHATIPHSQGSTPRHPKGPASWGHPPGGVTRSLLTSARITTTCQHQHHPAACLAASTPCLACM
jgi:hypothetical protein